LGQFTRRNNYQIYYGLSKATLCLRESNDGHFDHVLKEVEEKQGKGAKGGHVNYLMSE